jgi:2-polyprenyl-3-methyl-5-hydroxy-6-metoxy-1,4-benzoquinol methylase
MNSKCFSFFRNSEGGIKSMLNCVEEPSYMENPLGFFIRLARYKFASRFIKKTDEVIDVGCGNGLGTIFLKSFSKNVIGADIDKDLITHNKKSYNLKNLDFINFDILNPAPNKYDVVVSMDVIEHFNKKNTNTVIKNYAELTKNTGFAVIGTPSKSSSPYASKGRKDFHLYEFGPSEFKKALSRHFKQVFLFSMTDEVVSTSFPDLAWYLIALCVP